MNRILVTGSRKWTDAHRVKKVLELFIPYNGNALPELVHGDCPTGLDRMAARMWESWDGKTIAIPADWSRHGHRAGPLRNQLMVDMPGIVVCLAFPLGESYGTRDCMSRARAAGIPVLEVS